MKIAILDDCDCAKQSADWDRLGADVAIDFSRIPSQVPLLSTAFIPMMSCA